MDLGGGGPAAAAPAAAAPLADLLGGGLDQLIGGGGGLAADPVSGNVLNAKHTYCHGRLLRKYTIRTDIIVISSLCHLSS